MAGRRRSYSVQEVFEMICIPNVALSDTESISDDKIADPDFVKTPEAYESDSSFDEDEPLADIARTDPNQLDVEIHHAHADSDIEAPDDNDPQPGPAPINREFSWRQRKPPAADIDSSFQGPAFSTPPDEIPSPRLANRLTSRAGKEDDHHWKILQNPIRQNHLHRHSRGSLHHRLMSD
ncbi:hypothetical protein CRENBAI_010663 [Crenichthys baileyi]|uniref:Uncharacterized protein n=1 Tax=Crenichthys baileyi TaxID=28760 RepID=A0AAV9SLE4_9TELE